MPYVRDLHARCRCGHEESQHVRLPGHPDGAWECHGSEDCECAKPDVVIRARSRFA